ncbi:MAG: hypothetical protein AAGB51_01210 [Planctomycetota bacterium]
MPELEESRGFDESKPEAETEVARVKQFPCAQCGAKLQFSPGRSSLKCPYCTHETAVPDSGEGVEELDFYEYLGLLERQGESHETTSALCRGCGAQTELPPNLDAFSCPYCDQAIVAEPTKRRLLRPRSVLPFRIERKEARELFRSWIKRLWFAPNALKKAHKLNSKLNGLYIPYWTYDAYTDSRYTGMRGEHYYVTERYTVTVNGKRETRTRRVRKTRWWPASGRVEVPFDDVLVLASHATPKALTEALEPWDLAELKPYSEEYLAGFIAQRYEVDLAEGFEGAKQKMDPGIRAAVRRDIGGDAQRILSLQVGYEDVTFKHVLLPVWISAYRYKRKVYRFVINARTGEVRGERPWSIWKIAFAVLGVALIGAGTFFVINASQGG